MRWARALTAGLLAALVAVTAPPAEAAPTLRQTLERLAWVLPWRPPLAQVVIGSGFGMRRDPFRHRPAFHPGLDLEAPPRTPVLAAGAGRVAFAGTRGAYGRMVEIDHGGGVTTRYGHLSSVRVHRGQPVRAGQTIGAVGSTGRSTGPHLHYEVRVAGIPRNPLPFLHRRAPVTQEVSGRANP
jgi:murein DD-endopeptidase MepM/ murein hydrolase activator NlpD